MIPGMASSGWKNLYKVGAFAALLAVFVFRRNLGAELSLLGMLGIVYGLPTTPLTTASDWFLLLQNNPLVGLTLLNFFDVVEYALVGLMFLALYVALWKTSRSAMLIATTTGLIGITIYFASNQAFAMLSLSEQYALSSTESQHAIFLAAGESLLATNNPGVLYQGTGIYLSLFLVLLGGLMISVVMLQSKNFGRITGVMGILANGFGLGYFIALVFAPAIIWLPPTISAPSRMAWYILIAVKFIRLSKSDI
jgi:hypothetical protein